MKNESQKKKLMDVTRQVMQNKGRGGLNIAKNVIDLMKNDYGMNLGSAPWGVKSKLMTIVYGIARVWESIFEEFKDNFKKINGFFKIETFGELRIQDQQKILTAVFYVSQGKENKKKWMERDWLLSQFSESERQARKLFERFTLQGVDKEWNPQQEAKGFVLGGEEFSRWVREEWVRGKNKSDVTGIKELEKKIISVQERIERVNSLTDDRKLKRKLQIYVLRKYSPVSLREIGEQMGGMKYQSVHLVIKRLEESAKRDRRIREFLERCQ